MRILIVESFNYPGQEVVERAVYDFIERNCLDAPIFEYLPINTAGEWATLFFSHELDVARFEAIDLTQDICLAFVKEDDEDLEHIVSTIQSSDVPVIVFYLP